MKRRLLAASLVILTAWLLGNFWQTTTAPVALRTYPADLGGAGWIRASVSGPESYFRATIDLAAAPDSATLWLNADQVATVMVDGTAVSAKGAPWQSDAVVAPPRRPLVHAVDLTPLLQKGLNGLGIKVDNLDSRPAAIQARLHIVMGGTITDLLSTPGLWRATSDISLVRVGPLTGAPSYSETTFDDSAWPLAVRSTGDDPVIDSAIVPQWVMEQPALLPVLAPSGLGMEGYFAADITPPPQLRDAWLRLGASGPFTLEIDGSRVLEPGTVSVPIGHPDVSRTTRTPAKGLTLDLVDVTHYLHAGANHVVVNVAGGKPAMLYVDGYLDGARSATLVEPGSWRVLPVPGLDQLGGAPIELPLPALGSYLVKSRVPRALYSTADIARASRYGGMLVVVGLWALGALALGLARSGRRPITFAGCGAAAALAPGCVTLIGFAALQHVDDVLPPFPYVWPMLMAVLSILVATQAVAVATTVLAHRDQRVTADAAPRRVLPKRAFVGGVAAIAAASGALQLYRLNYQPYWQDELYSLAAAKGMRSHLLPQWPSGFLYFKSELYTALIAVVGWATHDSQSVLRGLSVVFFVATIVAVALGLGPLVLPGRRWAHLGLAWLFATAPPELVQARDVRMYQMAQFVAVCFAVCFIAALKTDRRRFIVGSAVLLVAMYLTHEETFCILPVIPILLVWSKRFSWLRSWTWLVSLAGAGAVIVLQLAATTLTHPPTFGVDPSNGPLIRWSPDPFVYLNSVFFPAGGRGPILTSVIGRQGSLSAISGLAVLAMIIAVCRRDTVRCWIGVFLVVPTAVLALLLPDKLPRYAFVLLPFLFTLAWAGFMDIVDGIKSLARSPDGQSARWLVTATCSMGLAALMVTSTGGLADYGVAVANLTGSIDSQRQIDFNYVSVYLKSHYRPGDIVIAACPPNIPAQYSGITPNYWMPYRRSERLLFVFEKGGQPVDTEYGIPTLMSGQQLQDVIDEHVRVWVVTSDSSYLGSLLPEQRRILQTNFAPVSEGNSATLYLRD